MNTAAPKKVKHALRLRPRYVTVGELREALARMDNEMPILIPAYDHSYRTLRLPRVVKVGVSPDGQFSEWYGEEQASRTEKPVDALVFHE